MEAPAKVCYSMGSINSLVEKISPLMENHPKMKDLLEDITNLREGVLNKFAGGRATGEQVKVWMKQVREMMYDIEDWLDLKQGAAIFSKSDEKQIDQKEGAASFSKSDEKQIDQFKDQIKEARDRCERYELLKQAATSGAQLPCAGPNEVAGRRLLWEEKSVLVGMDGPKSKLLNHLKNEQKKLKVVSIHGPGGLGKTALAMLIYGDMFIKEFGCQAFVSVGRTTSTRTTLIEILCQVMKSEADAWEFSTCNEIITELWEFLRTKRYFIYIDDIRNTQDSRAIICALPDNNLGSRILTTTRMKDIAISCSSRPSDVVYEMITLDETYAKSLFRNCVYVQEEEWPGHFEESSKKMLQVCCGVPVAIIITAGLLGRTSAELSVKSEKLNKTILSEFDQSYSTLQVMRKILEISYGDLPLPLKSCFLYLASFSGNYNINKDRLIRRWVAEGLIPGNSSWETGESYFDELISRRLIQPAFDDSDDEPIGCTVHGVVFDFMEHLSTQENFVTAGAELKSGLFPCDRVRRVSLDYDEEDDEGDTYCLLEQKSRVALSSHESSSSDEEEAISLHLSRVRSIAFSGDARRIPDLSALKHVRVLDLEDTKGLEEKQFESIGRLSLLRYLGLGRTYVAKLPPEIMALEQLTTLDLRRTGVRHLPEFREKKLVSLLGDQLILQERMRGMQQLEELSKVLLGGEGLTVESMTRIVIESPRLRMLGVIFSRLIYGQNETDRREVRHFLEEVGKSNLHSLLLDNYPHPLLDLLVDSWVHNLRKFELRISGPHVIPLPQERASLKALTHLHINVESVEAQTVRALGNLPNLALLELYSNTSPCLTLSSKDGFQCLKVLWYNSRFGDGMGLRFEVGAMPQLRRLRLDLDARKTVPKNDDFDFGIEHLPNLVRVCATIDWTHTSLTASEVVAAEVHIREQVCRSPNNPVLELNRRRLRPVAKAEELVIAINRRQEWVNQINRKKLVVIHFTASWCRPSSKMAPVFSDLANKFRTVVFLKVDIDEMKVIAEQFGVEELPTFMFMKDGSVKDMVAGGGKGGEQQLKEKLDEQLALL